MTTTMIDDHDALKAARDTRLLQQRIKDINDLIKGLEEVGCRVTFSTEGALLQPPMTRLSVQVSLSLVRPKLLSVKVGDFSIPKDEEPEKGPDDD